MAGKEDDSEQEKKRKAHKRSLKNIDASWTKKHGENHYGYKDHVKDDKKTKLIEKYSALVFISILFLNGQSQLSSPAVRSSALMSLTI